MNLKTRRIILTAVICCSTFQSLAFASPDEAKEFAAQFKKNTEKQEVMLETAQKPQKTAEDVVKKLENQKESSSPIVAKINETPNDPIVVFGEGISPNYRYIPQPEDDLSLPFLEESVGPKYSFDWQGAPLTSVFYGLGRISHKNVIVVDEDDLEDAHVYATFNNATLDEIISYLTASYGLNYQCINGNYLISKDDDTMLQSERFLIHYADKDKIIEEIKALGVESSRIYSNDQYGAITVTGNNFQLSQVKRLIKSIDKPVSQCLIVAQLIETTHAKDLDVGLTYTMPTYTHNVDEAVSHQNWFKKMSFGVTSQLNEAISNGVVLSRPVVVTENGHEAEIFMGDSVPIPQQNTADGGTTVSFTYQDVGSNLKIKPSIDKHSGIITLTIDTEIKNIVSYISQGNMQAPQIASREAQTIAHLKSGQTFIIGGLMSKEEMDTVSGIPLLRKLPILGKLFEYHSKDKQNTEAFIAITPFILNEDERPEDILIDARVDSGVKDNGAK